MLWGMKIQNGAQIQDGHQNVFMGKNQIEKKNRIALGKNQIMWGIDIANVFLVFFLKKT
jgi:hypothetical protein